MLEVSIHFQWSLVIWPWEASKEHITIKYFLDQSVVSNLVLYWQPEFNLIDLPLFIITSVGAGVIGAVLNIVHDRLAQFRPTSKHKSLRYSSILEITSLAENSIFNFVHRSIIFWSEHCNFSQVSKSALAHDVKYRILLTCAGYLKHA